MSGKDDLAYGYYPGQGQGQEQGDRASGEGGTRKLLGSALKTFRDKYDKYGSSSQQQQSPSSQQNQNQQQQYGSGQPGSQGYNPQQPQPYQQYPGSPQPPPSGQQQPYQEPYQQHGGNPTQQGNNKPPKQDMVSGLFGKIQGVGSDIAQRIGSNLDPQSYATYGPGSQGNAQNPHGSFAPRRNHNDAKWYVDGCSYMWAVSRALESARESIWILDWWLSPELYLRRPPHKNEQYRIDRMLQAAAQRGVKVNIIVYKEVTQALTLSSSHTKHHLEDLHPNIAVFRHPDHLPDRKNLHNSVVTSLQNMTLNAAGIAKLSGDALKGVYGMHENMILYWAHHEKLCLVDGKTAFMGGLDLCFGRWDTHQHPIADVHPNDINATIFPGQDYNNARVLDFQDVVHWEKNQLDRKVTSRMGWSDVAVSLHGPVVEDLRRHFVERWNYIYDDKYAVRKDTRHSKLTLYARPLSSIGGGGQQHQGQQYQGQQQPGQQQQGQQQQVQQQQGQQQQGQQQQGQQYQGQQFQGQQQQGQQPPTQHGQAGYGQAQGPGSYGGNSPQGQGNQQNNPAYGGQQNYPPPPPGPPPQQTQPEWNAGNTGSPAPHSQSQSPAPSQASYFSPPGGPSQQQSEPQWNAGNTGTPTPQSQSHSPAPGQAQYFPPPPTQDASHSQTRGFEGQGEPRGEESRSRGFGSDIRGLKSEVSNFGNVLRGQLAGQVHHYQDRYLTGQPGSQGQGRSNMSCQIVRSSAKWSHGTETEHSIADAYAAVIRDSEHFVYIENQFFITATGDKQKPVKNQIGAAIVERIVRAAKAGEKYQMIIVIPSVPGFAGDLREDGSLGTRAIMEFQYDSINRGGNSIMEMIAREGFNPMQYIRFYNLRNYDRINVSAAMQQAEKSSGVGYEDARKQHDSAMTGSGPTAFDTTAAYPQYQQAAQQVQQGQSQNTGAGRWNSVSECYMLGGEDIRNVPWEHGNDTSEIDAFISEELYVHSKVLIADDRTVICGSANINDRSQLGYHDSEIAIIIQDPTPLETMMNGKPYVVSRFAATLRREITRKHLGLIRPQDFERPDANFEPVGVPNNYELGTPEDRMVADPVSDTFLSLWNTRARQNTEVYRKVFHVVPDDSVRNWNDYKEFYEYYFRPADKKKESESPAPANAPARYEWGHVISDEFPGGVGEVKEELSKVKGTLVEMPLMFLVEEDIAKEGIGLNSVTEEVYT